MPTIQDVIAQYENELADAQASEADARGQIQAQIELAQREGRSNFTAAEDAQTEALFTSVGHARAAQRRARAALERARAVEDDDRRIQAQQADVRTTTAVPAARTASVSVGREQRTYGRHNDPHGTGRGFVGDVLAAQVNGDPEAWQRLARHMAEERVERGAYMERAAGDLLTSGIGSVSVPQYLVDLTGEAAGARRPLADACQRHPLPAEGMTVTIPCFTTATSAALQTTQLTGVSATSAAVTDLVMTVQTAAGSQQISRQAADRSRVDEFVLRDLILRYNTVLDSTLLNQATTGLSAKALGTLGSFTATQPTGALLYPKILAAQGGVEAVVMGAPADTVVMHSRRWAWLSKEMTSTWPLINSANLPVQAGGVSNNANYGGYRGVLPNGLKVLVDNSVSTAVSGTQDEIYVVPSSECHLWESPGSPVFIRAEQPAATTLGILLVVFGYFCYTFDRMGSGSMQKVSGAGLTTPAF